MMKDIPRLAPALAVLLAPALLCALSTPPLVCPAGAPIGSVDLRVSSPRGKGALPLRTINRLDGGDLILYRPVLHTGEKRHGEVTVVLVPASPAPRGEKFLVLEPKDAGQPQQWKAPWRVATVAYVYGPAGLNTRKVAGFLHKSDELVDQLADYAAKTAETEALIAALSPSSESTQAVMQSTLQGFASQYGLKVQLDATATGKQQALAMFQTLNPAMANYDPISPDVSQQFGRTAGLAASVAALFFGSPVGLAAGGTAMLMDLRAMAFPNSQFRSSFSEPRPNDALGLCGKTDPPPAHTKLVYLWASRVSNAAAPQLTVGKERTLPPAMKATLSITAPDADWKLLERLRDWSLQPDTGKPVPVKVQPVEAAKTLQIELDKSVAPGSYTLTANWDWERVTAKGRIEVRSLEDFHAAHLDPPSQDRLTAQAGKQRVALEGADFEFVTKAEIKSLEDEFAPAENVPFALSPGFRQGPQTRLDLQIDTAELAAGRYKLVLTQMDDKTHAVPLRVLPPSPTIDNLPLLVNQGDSPAALHLKGHHLRLLQAVDLSRGRAELSGGAGDDAERDIRVAIPPDVKIGTTLPLTARVEDRSEPLTFAGAVRVVGPRPRIRNIEITLPPDSGVALAPGELPGDSSLSALLEVEQLKDDSVARLSCSGDPASRALTVRLGERTAAASFQPLTADQAFLSLDTGHWLNGCALQVAVSDPGEGESEVRALGRVVRLPSIQSVEMGMPGPVAVEVEATLIGQNLETIGKLGWSDDDGDSVSALPLAVSGAGAQQTLRTMMLAPPSPDAALYIWLRGETRARATRVHPAVMN